MLCFFFVFFKFSSSVRTRWLTQIMRCPTTCGRMCRCHSTCPSTSSTSSTLRRSWKEKSPWWSKGDLMCIGMHQLARDICWITRTHTCSFCCIAFTSQYTLLCNTCWKMHCRIFSSLNVFIIFIFLWYPSKS